MRSLYRCDVCRGRWGVWLAGMPLVGWRADLFLSLVTMACHRQRALMRTGGTTGAVWSVGVLRGSVLCVGVLGLLLGQARGDVLQLHSGGRLAGEIQGEPRPNQAGGAVTIKTLSGAKVIVAGEAVESLKRRKLAHEEYERRAQETPETVADQWELAEWCRQNGLSAERRTHLRRVVALDTNHAAARKGLGYTRHGGEWMTHAQLMTSRGLVKHKGKWVLPQEIAFIEQAAAETDAEKQWYKSVRKWFGWITGDDPNRQAEGLAELRRVRDATAAPAVLRTFQKARAEPLRLLLVELLSQIEGPRAFQGLVELSLFDDLDVVRDASLRGVRVRGATPALPIYLKALRSENNRLVNRAGKALGQVGDDTVVDALIEALVTRHQYKVRVPTNMIGTTPDGRMIQAIDPSQLPPEIAQQLATGQLPYGVAFDNSSPVGFKQPTRQVIVKQDEKNSAVLESLTLLTNENYGFDEAAWRRWRESLKSAVSAPRRRSGS